MAAEFPKPKSLAELQSEATSRGASPQPTHFSVRPSSASNGHKVLRSATVGYIAPAFQGKEEQMKTGKRLNTLSHKGSPLIRDSSATNHPAGWMDP